MKKSEMERAFSKELDIMKKLLMEAKRKESKQNYANFIYGAACLAERLGIIDFEQKRYITEEANAAVLGMREDPLDEVC